MISHTALTNISRALVLNSDVTSLIDDITLSDESVSITVVHADDMGPIETETLEISSDGTIQQRVGRTTYIRTVEDLQSLPKQVKEVLAHIIRAMRDGVVHGDHPELELIADHRQFYLDRQDAFVPAGVLCAAGIVDEHNEVV